ncbi:Tn3 family transposase [Amycolatopsis pithecellobii]|uniref:Tn3 family transposase n=1 Tax=Amycolatopsis pithecellobii TaxID=664692 RepID=UPI0035E41059
MAGRWGDGHAVAVDGSQSDTWDNILAETSIRYGGYGGIAFRHISDTYIALCSRFIPCGVWEAVYIIEGLLRNDSDIRPDTIHADTQGQSLPVFGLAALLGFDLLPRWEPDRHPLDRPAAHGSTGPSGSWVGSSGR